jgi:hypothetical protein
MPEETEAYIKSLLVRKKFIDITLPLNEVVDDAEVAIAAQPAIFQKSGEIVSIVHVKDEHIIRPLRSAIARYYLSCAAFWIKPNPSIIGDDEECDPPTAVVQCLLEKGEWEHIRPIRAIVNFPPIDALGHINFSQGYDPNTSVFFAGAPDCIVPEHPTLNDAKKAIQLLHSVVQDFPFASLEHRSAWIAALITPLIRFAHDGNSPIVVIQANSARVGKTTLVKIISMIITGVDCPVIVAAGTEDESRKRIMSYLRIARGIVLVDNVVGTWGGASINAMATSRVFEDRVLGATKLIQAQNDTTWYVCGNNISLSPDTAQRSLHIRLETKEEFPHLRKDFAYPDDSLLSMILERRGELLSAALTIVKAYQKSPMNVELSSWGSFQSWSRLVRGALIWAGEPDPANTRFELESDDINRTNACAIIEGWMELQHRLDKTSLSVLEVLLAMMNDKEIAQQLRGTLGITGNHFPTSVAIEGRLRELKDRVLGGLIMRCKHDRGGDRWFVEGCG